MTTPVEVEPAPPDLATGLQVLARTVRARAGEGAPLLLLAADLEVHAEALADLGEDPRPGTAVLVGAPAAGTPGISGCGPGGSSPPGRPGTT